VDLLYKKLYSKSTEIEACTANPQHVKTTCYGFDVSAITP